MADPAALDGARWRRRRDVTVLRFAPDEAFAHRRHRASRSTTQHAIVDDETGFVGGSGRPATCVRRTSNGRSRSSDRPSPRGRSPASRRSCWLTDDGGATIVVHAAYADELAWTGCDERLHPDPARRSAGRTGRRGASYDVVIIGGGGHGLSTAYHLATRHGITNVAVIEADYIASGNTGRNTTIIRANYGIPESIRFYQHSLERYQALEEETGAAILHQTKGIIWLAHTEMAMRTERARAAMNQACGAQTYMRTPAGAQGARPAAGPHRRRPLPGPRRLAPRRGRHRPARPGRLGVRERRVAARRRHLPAHAA